MRMATGRRATGGARNKASAMQTLNTEMNPTLDSNQRSIALIVVERWWRWPIITAALFGAAMAAAVWPWLAQAYTLDRAAIHNGEWWRLLTGHLAHWSFDHLIWDVAVFSVLGVVCERRDRRQFVICLLVSAIVISLGVLAFCPQFERYRGLSGVDCALFGLCLTTACQSSGMSRQGRCLLLIAGVGFVLKVSWELATGGSLFVQSDVMTPVPESHAIGAAVGVIVALVFGNSIQCKSLKCSETISKQQPVGVGDASVPQQDTSDHDQAEVVR